jgi:hypothetical protein
MSHKYEVEMIREGETEPVATAVFQDIEEAKKYIKGHGPETTLKFVLYFINAEKQRTLV